MWFSLVQQGLLERTLPSAIVGALAYVLWEPLWGDPDLSNCVAGDKLEGSVLRPLFTACENIFGGTMWGTVGSWRAWLVALLLGGATLIVTLGVMALFPKTERFLAAP